MAAAAILARQSRERRVVEMEAFPEHQRFEWNSIMEQKRTQWTEMGPSIPGPDDGRALVGPPSHGPGGKKSPPPQ